MLARLPLVIDHLDFAGVDTRDSLRSVPREVVLGEAMKPFLSYGWQPQIMAVQEGRKAIFAGTTEVYELDADPAEARNLGSGANLSAEVRKALDEYPVPAIDAAKAPAALSDEAKRSLASLGYVSATSAPLVLRKRRLINFATCKISLNASVAFASARRPKFSRVNTTTVVSSVAIADADRGSSSTSAISPIATPFDAVAIVFIASLVALFLISTLPVTSRHMCFSTAPSAKITSPFFAV
jgi:hypothetical protein